MMIFCATAEMYIKVIVNVASNNRREEFINPWDYMRGTDMHVGSLGPERKNNLSHNTSRTLRQCAGGGVKYSSFLSQEKIFLSHP